MADSRNAPQSPADEAAPSSVAVELLRSEAFKRASASSKLTEDAGRLIATSIAADLTARMIGGGGPVDAANGQKVGEFFGEVFTRVYFKVTGKS